jgi:hypothetical protein
MPQHNYIAEHLIVMISLVVQTVSTTICLDHCANCFRLPTVETHFNFVPQLNAVAGLKLLKDFKCVGVIHHIDRGKGCGPLVF